MVMTKAQSAQIVGNIFGGHGKVPEPAVFSAWHDAIKDLDYPVAVNAAKDYIKTGGAWPSVSEYLAVVNALVNGVAPDESEAAKEVRAAVNKVGYTGTPQWSHPAIATAMDTLGWKEFCRTEEQFAMPRFLKAYANVKHRVTRTQTIELTGGNSSEILEKLARAFDPDALGKG